jgi:hypothetical protein
MGSSQSYVSQPELFATPVADDKNGDETRWKEYDYIIVGGGVFCVL